MNTARQIVRARGRALVLGCWIALTTLGAGLAACGGGSGGSTPAPPPSVAANQSLPAGAVGVAYSGTLAATSGTPPYTWSIVGGSLPPGMTLASATGVISGTDTTMSGTFDFTAQVEDASHQTSMSAPQSMQIAPATLSVTGSLGSLTAGTAVDATFMATPSTTGPYQWKLASGALPTGLSLGTSTTDAIAITGTPTIGGESYSFTLSATDGETPTAATATTTSIAGTVAIESGETAPVVTANQSLPAGIAGSPYSGSLAATGGAPPYVWSLVAGSLPAGLALDSASGAITGTDATVNGQFRFSVQVLDANNNLSASSGQSLQIAPAQLSISGSLGSLSAGVPVNAAFTASPATVGSYTWTIASGSLPTGLTLAASTSSAVVISGTPTSAGQAYSFTLGVTDGETPTAGRGTSSAPIAGTVAAPATAACPARGQEGALAHQSFALLVNGFDASGNPFVLVGSFTVDGTGTVTSAELDYNNFDTGPQHVAPAQITAAYALGADQRGCLGLVISGAGASAPASLVLSFALNAAATGGTIIEFDDPQGTGSVANGVLYLQSSAAFTATPNANYAFGLGGWDNGGGRFAMAGSFTVGTAVAGSYPLSQGFADINSDGISTGELTGGSGSVATPSALDGRATATLTTTVAAGAALTQNFTVYVVNSSLWLIASSDAIGANAPFITSGRALAAQASYGAAPLSGAYLYAMTGYDYFAGTTDATIGTGLFATDGTLQNASTFENDGGNYHFSTAGTGSYSADTANPASGRVSVTGLAGAPLVVYLCNPLGAEQIAGFVVGSDGSSSLGELVLQSAGGAANLSKSSLSGAYAFGSVGDLDNSNANYAGTVQMTGGSYTYSNDVSIANSAGPPFIQTAVTGNSSYTVNADGTGTINGNGFVLVTNGAQAFAIPTAVDGMLYVIQQ